MSYLFYIVGMISILTTIWVIIEKKPMYAILYLIVSFLSISVIFFIIGSDFAGALEVIIYSGAIMLLFVFIIMLLNIGEKNENKIKQSIQHKNWQIPICFMTIFLVKMINIISHLDNKYNIQNNNCINVQDINTNLFTHYSFIIEISSILLLSALVNIFHLNQKK